MMHGQPSVKIQLITSHRSKLQLITSHRSKIQLITSHRSKIQLITSHRSKIQRITSHRSKIQLITSHRSKIQLITSHRSITTCWISCIHTRCISSSQTIMWKETQIRVQIRSWNTLDSERMKQYRLQVKLCVGKVPSSPIPREWPSNIYIPICKLSSAPNPMHSNVMYKLRKAITRNYQEQIWKHSTYWYQYFCLFEYSKFFFQRKNTWDWKKKILKWN